MRELIKAFKKSSPVIEVRQRVKALEEAKQTVLAHCLCLALEENTDNYTVILPEGYHIDGVRCGTNKGKAWTLQQILTRLEAEWRASCL